MHTTVKTFIGVCIFSIAMAALESAVVVYLRALYYPEGFSVAFKLIDVNILKVEILREFATIIMLLMIGYLAGHTFKDRMAYFLLAFAVWDIAYYGWLKVLINWPASIFEWDILFLIPFTWLAPVLAPLICSMTMISLALILLFYSKPLSAITWGFVTAGSVFILYTFMENYGSLIVANGFIHDFANILQNEKFLNLAAGYIPDSYNWTVFLLGEIFLLTGIYFHLRRFRDHDIQVSVPI